MYEQRPDQYDGIDHESAALIDEFCAQAEVVSATRHKYRFHLTEFARWLAHPRIVRGGESTTLVDVAPGDISRFMAYLRSGERFAARAHYRITGNLSASARKNALSSIRSFYRYLVSVQILKIDPSAPVRPPRVTVKPGLHLATEELRALLDAPGKPRERVATFLLVYTAARVDEIRNLRWCDVDFAARTIVVRGKGDKYRVLDIHGALAAELRRWWLYVDELSHRNIAIREAMQSADRDFVLLTPSGKQIGRNAISRHIKARAARIGLRPRDGDRTEVSPHALRRSFATLLLNDGHHIDAVADVLGHVNIDTTRKHYAFASNARRRATMQAFNV